VDEEVDRLIGGWVNGFMGVIAKESGSCRTIVSISSHHRNSRHFSVIPACLVWHSPRRAEAGIQSGKYQIIQDKGELGNRR